MPYSLRQTSTSNAPNRRQFAGGFGALALFSTMPQLTQAGTIMGSPTLEHSLSDALRAIGSPMCLKASEQLQGATRATVTLHLRSADIDAEGAGLIAKAMARVSLEQQARLRSFSLSYNPIGNDGAVRLARALPTRLASLGLVGCGIADTGAMALLDWTRQAAGLGMICIEGNEIARPLRQSFADLGRQTPGLSVYV